MTIHLFSFKMSLFIFAHFFWGLLDLFMLISVSSLILYHPLCDISCACVLIFLYLQSLWIMQKLCFFLSMNKNVNTTPQININPNEFIVKNQECNNSYLGYPFLWKCRQYIYFIYHLGNLLGNSRLSKEL